MEPLLSSFGATAATVADVLVGSAWRGLVLVAGVAFLLRCMPRLTAGTRSAMWTAVLALLLLLPILPLLPFRAGATQGATGHSLLHAGAGWSVAIVAVWALLSLLRLSQLLRSALRLWHVSRQAVPVRVGEEIEGLLRRAPRRVRLCASADVGRPSIAGFLRPRILLPAGLLEDLSESELEHVVLHELEHLRRGDDWINLLQKLSLALLPMHPALLWLDRRLCVERELACDEGVLRVTGARKRYAACLARLAEDSMMHRIARRGLSLAVGLLGVRARRSELSGRVERILRSPSVPVGRGQMTFAAAALFGVVAGGAVLLGRSPQLVSFTAAPAPETFARTPVPSRVVGEVPLVQSAGAAPSFRATGVKAVMQPQAAPRITRAVAHMSRKPSGPLRRVAFGQAPQQMVSPAPYVVLTAWHQETMPRMTLTLAEDSQPTYAAVPVRGGWLLIQL